MCTAITYRAKDHYFGRNLDLEHHYHEAVTITPRNYPFRFRRAGELPHHYAIIGMAAAEDNYPLYYDATNEKGLSMAGLSFPGLAVYGEGSPEKDNITPYELIPWVLGQCANMEEAMTLLKRLTILGEPFSKTLPLSPLHWILCDRNRCVTLEPFADGLRIWENPVGVLTNNPPFDYHMYKLTEYLNVTREPAQNRFAKGIDLEPYSRGMGSIGIPGDLSSASRFVRAVFTKMNSVSGHSEAESVSQFFHILGSVAQQRGPVHIRGRLYEFTTYSSCCNTDLGIYYYKTYENSQITAVELARENLEGRKIISYPLLRQQQIRRQNQTGSTHP